MEGGPWHGCYTASPDSIAVLICMEPPRIFGRWWNGGAVWLALFCAQFASAQGQEGGPHLSASQSITGKRSLGAMVTLTVTLNNTGGVGQPDNSDPEFTETLPKRLALVSVTASSGTSSFLSASDANGGVVRWDGSIPAAGSATITITAVVD